MSDCNGCPSQQQCCGSSSCGEPSVDREGSGSVKTIIVDRDLCIGAAACTVLAPEIYEMDGENKAILKEGWEKKGYDTEYHLEAARSCPVDAVILKDEEGNQIYP